MKRKKVLDSHAILVYLKQEEGFQEVREELRRAGESGNRLLVNEINLGEVCSVALRNRLVEDLGRFLEILLTLPIEPVHPDFPLIVEASLIKARYPISYADCFAVATALREKAKIMTGDPEFKKVEKLVEVQWL